MTLDIYCFHVFFFGCVPILTLELYEDHRS